jgi:hypothetical protein
LLPSVFLADKERNLSQVKQGRGSDWCWSVYVYILLHLFFSSITRTSSFLESEEETLSASSLFLGVHLVWCSQCQMFFWKRPQPPSLSFLEIVVDYVCAFLVIESVTSSEKSMKRAKCVIDKIWR